MALSGVLIDVTPLRSSAAFRRLWFGRTLSALGSQMTVVAVAFQVWQLTGSTVWTGAVALAQAVPVIVFGLFLGAVVDRVERRRFVLLTTAGQATCSILLAVQGFAGPLPVQLVILLVAVQSCFVAGGGPASRTFITRLLPPEQVAAGLALNRITFESSMLLGPALGGLTVASFGVGGCYLIDALTFAMAFYGTFLLPAMRPDGEPSRPGLSGIRDGLAFLLRHRVVRAALLTDLAATVLCMPISVFPLLNAERFGNDPRTLGLFLSAIAVGGVLASAFSGTFTRASQPGLLMLGGSATWGLAVTLCALCPQPWLGLAFLALAGAADTVSVVTRGAIVQLHTPDALRGRVAAAEQIVGQAGPDLGNLRGGLVAGFTSGSTALVSGGLMCVLAVTLIGASTPALRRYAGTPPVAH